MRTARPVRIGTRVVVVIQHVRVESSSGRGALGVHAFVRPCAVVVGEGASWRAIDLEGEGIPLDRLLQEVRGLKEVVRGENRGG